jgi:cytochrome P450
VRFAQAMHYQEDHNDVDQTRKESHPMRQTLRSLHDISQQYRWFRHMRTQHPVWLDDASGCWHVFRYADVEGVLTDYTGFSSSFRRRIRVRPALGAPSLIEMDPPQHSKYRALISPAFTPRALAQLSGRITAIVQELLDRVRSTGRMEVIGDLAYPLPSTVIAEMLGVPAEDRPIFKRWADVLFSSQISDADLLHAKEPEELRRVEPTMQEMNAYFAQKLDDRRRQPRADLLSELLAAEVDGQHLREEELTSFCVLLLLAGHVTTTNLIGQAILCFDAHPETMDQLRAQPDLMPGAIEEVLRYASVVWRLGRITTADTNLDTVRIPANSVVFAWIASANRDGAQFPNPDRFDITRSPNRHLAFGHGIHFCVGAPLARLEASIALPMMLEQLPHLRRVPHIPVELLPSRALSGVKRLPITFAPATASRSTA